MDVAGDVLSTAQKGSAVECAAADAAALLARYDRAVLCGYDRAQETALVRCGYHGLATAETAETAGALANALRTLARAGGERVRDAPIADACRYWLRRRLASVASELQRRAGHRTLRGEAAVGRLVDKLLADVGEALAPWGIVRAAVEPIVAEAERCRARALDQ